MEGSMWWFEKKTMSIENQHRLDLIEFILRRWKASYVTIPNENKIYKYLKLSHY